MNVAIEPEDYRWLVGPAAAEYLAPTGTADSLVQQAARLRRSLSTARVHLVLEQIELRRRAREKFSRAAEMFFTRVALEQATDEVVARYKAERFGVGLPVYDLCCGIGGDLLALAARGPAIGVDRDRASVILAEANLQVCNQHGEAVSKVEVSDVAEVHLQDAAAWHCDPDRRPTGRRTTRVELHEPGADLLVEMLSQCSHAGIKLAPAAELPVDWSARGEQEWISRGGECRQLVAWFGNLARRPGKRCATLVASGGAVRTLAGDAPSEPPIAARIGSFVFEPDAAVLAAKLSGTLAAEHGASALAPGIAYLTADRPIRDAALAAFEVLETLPYQPKLVKAWLKARGIGRLEVKKRGVSHDPEVMRRQLRVAGDAAATLLLAPLAGGVTAILARRLPG